MNAPLCIDLYCGLGGWAEGFLAEGYECTGFDIEAHDYGTGGYPGKLILRDVRSIHGSELKEAAVIVASPPCQEPSYRAMCWKRAKALTPQEVGLPEPAWWRIPEKASKKQRGMTIAELLEWAQWKRDYPKPAPELFIQLFNECFRIQREASEAAGHYIPLVVENVRGAQKWVGRAQWHYGSFYLWGDVPALMPMTLSAWNHSEELRAGRKTAGHANIRDGHTHARHLTNPRESELLRRIDESGTKGGGDWFGSGEDCSLQRRFSGTKQAGISGPRNNGKGDAWFQDGAARHGSQSTSRKAASAMIAKIPLPLSLHIARCFKPVALEATA